MTSPSISALLLGLALLTAAPAHADDVEVHTEEGHVIAATIVDAPMDAARALLASPARLARLEGRGAEVTSRPKDGCIESDIVASTGVGKVEYSARSCPVADGFEGTLISGEQIREMRARWTLREQDGRLVIQYDFFVVPRIRVPQRLVAVLAKRGVRRLVEAVRDELEREVASPAP
jgi:hypothetical protein